MKRLISSKLISCVLIMILAVHLNSCNFLQISNAADDENSGSENSGLNPEQPEIYIDPVKPSQSGKLHNEILEIFSENHTLKPASLSKKEIGRASCRERV